MNCTPRTHGLPSGSINGQSKDEVLRRVLCDEEDRPLRPTRQGVLQVLVHLGTLLVRLDFDILIELLEGLKREVCDLEFAK